jgi:hypothetical protein
MSLGAAATAWTWVAFAVALLTLLVGTATLARKQIIFPWMRDRDSWKVRGWADILFGTFVLVETIPRLSHAPVGFVLVCSEVAFIPLGLAILLMVRSAYSRG